MQEKKKCPKFLLDEKEKGNWETRTVFYDGNMRQKSKVRIFILVSYN